MTVSSGVSKIVYAAGGGAPPYAVPFLYLETGHVEVVRRAADGSETVWREGTHYALTPAGDPSGGMLTVAAGHRLAAGESLTIRRDVPRTQETDYQEAGRFPAETHERALDKLTMIAQQLAERAGRTLTVPRSDRAGDMAIPIDAERAGRFLAFDGGGRPVAAAGASADLGPVSAFIATLLDNADAGAARATLGLGGVDLAPPGELPFRLFTVTDASPAYVGDGAGPSRRLDFAAGSGAVARGQTVVGRTSGARGEAELDAVVTAGSHAASDAQGYLVLKNVSGAFRDGETLQVSSAARAVSKGTAAKVYNTRYLNGVWIACDLEWSAADGFLSRREGATDATALALHIATEGSPSDPSRAVSLVRVRGASAAARRQNPARLVSPAAGEAGGYEALQTWPERSAPSFAGEGVAFGDGARSRARICHVRSGGGDYSGVAVNAFADFSGTDRANEPSFFFGLRRAGNGARAFVLLHEAAQNGAAAGAARGRDAVAWTERMAIPADRGPLSAELVMDPYATGRTLHRAVHGLGGMPTGVSAFLENKTAEHNFTPGDRVAIAIGGETGPTREGAHVQVKCSASGAEIRTSANRPQVLDGSNAFMRITSARWKLAVVLERLR